MDKRAAKVTGITDETIQSAPHEFGITFIEFLCWVQVQNIDSLPVLLVAHNGMGFDLPIILQEMERHRIHLRTLQETNIVAIFDTLKYLKDRKYNCDPVSRRPFPTTKKGAVSYNLGGVFRTCFPDETFQEHDALADTTAMRRVLDKIHEWSNATWMAFAVPLRSEIQRFHDRRGDRTPFTVDTEVPSLVKTLRWKYSEWCFESTFIPSDEEKEEQEEEEKEKEVSDSKKRKRDDLEVAETVEATFITTEQKAAQVENQVVQVEQVVRKRLKVRHKSTLAKSYRTCEQCKRIVSVYFEHWESECVSIESSNANK